MKKSFILVAMLGMAVLSVFTACKKDKNGADSNVLEEVTLFGTVIDATTGDPLYNAQVYLEKYPDLSKDGSTDDNDYGVVGSSVTGTDGSYEFTIYNVAKNGHYEAYAEKVGYQVPDQGDLVSFAHTKDGGRVKVDFRLTKSN